MPLLFEILAALVFYYCLWQVLWYCIDPGHLTLEQWRVRELQWAISEFDKLLDETQENLYKLQDNINKELILRESIIHGLHFKERECDD